VASNYSTTSSSRRRLLEAWLAAKEASWAEEATTRAEAKTGFSATVMVTAGLGDSTMALSV
jgi:hypothetical protein